MSEVSLATIPKWSKKGEVISRTFEFPDFMQSIYFVNKIALVAEEHNHHPGIDIRWNKVTLSLTTHDAGKLTDKDIKLAERCDVFAA